MDQDVIRYGGIRRPKGHCVQWGPSSPPRKKGTDHTQFLAHIYCGQTAGWIKMPLGMEVNLGPGDVLLDGVTAPPKRDKPPGFGSCLLWPNSWMDEDATWCRSKPRPRPHCVSRGPNSPRKGHSSPLFSADVCCGHGRTSQLLLSSCS